MPFQELKIKYDSSMLANDFESARETAQIMFEKRYTGAEALLYFALLKLQEQLPEDDTSNPILQRIKQIETTITIY